MTRSDHIVFWVNAYIPEVVPGWTHTDPRRPRQSWIGLGVPLMDCYLTDAGRLELDEHGKGSRLHSELSLWLLDGRLVAFTQSHATGPTVEVECGDGEWDGAGQASTERMRFWRLPHATGSSTRERIRFELVGRAANPRVPLSPDVQYRGVLAIDGLRRRLSFEGCVGDFPAFEAGFRVNGGRPRPLFAPGLAGANPWGLLHGCAKPVDSEVDF